MFLLPSINMKLRPKILDLRPGTRIVSNSFTMEDWEADETATLEGGRLRGGAIEFTAGGAHYTGRVNGTAMQGTVTGGSNGSWTATRQ